ncbi:MAG: putative DNA modification/repair radical SAM protein [Lentisphaeria bacterium]
MDLARKIAILGEAARYDASCASSGTRREAPAGGMGGAALGGICHSWADDGRCISLLKILFSNFCEYDCAYCINRRSNDIPRAAFTVEEVVRVTLEFYRRNYIEGLFLSSGVTGGPDATMERLARVAETLRVQHRFAGYIHLKAIPGASPGLLRRAGLFADRLSVNIELPSGASLQRLAPDKNRDGILQPMGLIGRSITESKAERRKSRAAPRFAPAGQSTQLIVGASPENDRHILQLASSLYSHFSLKRVYYSAFVPGGNPSLLPALVAPPLRREHRLYQADWLMRFYGFAADELLDAQHPQLDDALDPKAAWALRHPQCFPVDLNRAELGLLLRVPGVGPTSARRIVNSRRFAPVRFEDLAKLGVVLRRARYFICCPGQPADGVVAAQAPERVRGLLAASAAGGPGAYPAAAPGDGLMVADAPGLPVQPWLLPPEPEAPRQLPAGTVPTPELAWGLSQPLPAPPGNADRTHGH